MVVFLCHISIWFNFKSTEAILNSENGILNFSKHYIQVFNYQTTLLSYAHRFKHHCTYSNVLGTTRSSCNKGPMW